MGGNCGSELVWVVEFLLMLHSHILACMINVTGCREPALLALVDRSFSAAMMPL